MSWQDIVIMTTSIVFSISLVPQVIHGWKTKTGLIKPQTSVPTFVGCYVIAFTYLTLNLYLSALFSAVIGTLWLVLFIQKMIYKKTG